MQPIRADRLRRWVSSVPAGLFLLAPPVWAAPPDAAPTTRAATPAELQLLLSRTYQPVPNKFHFRARVTVLSPSWSEAEVEKELRTQNQLMREHDRQLSPGQRQELEAVRRDGIRRARSGTNVFDVEVWVSGELYRKDETWTSIPSPSQRSYVFLGEPRFTNKLAYIANRSIGSVTLYTNLNWPVALDRLWEGYSLEPQLTVPVLALLGSVRQLPTPTDPPPLRNFDGLEVTLDEAKSRQLIEGTHAEYALRLDETTVGRSRVIRFRFEPRRPSQGQAVQVTYWLDASDSRRLHRVETQAAGQPLLVATRSGFGDTGWPRVWTSQSLDARGRVITKQVEYLGAVDDQFDDVAVFAPVFPKDYLVSVSAGSGVAQLIQNPRGSRVVQEASGPARPFLARLVPILVCLVFIALPLALAKKSGFRRGVQ